MAYRLFSQIQIIGSFQSAEKVSRLVELALGDRAVAEVAHANLIATLVVDGEPTRRPGEDGAPTMAWPPRKFHTLVEQMHRARPYLAQARRGGRTARPWPGVGRSPWARQ